MDVMEYRESGGKSSFDDRLRAIRDSRAAARMDRQVLDLVAAFDDEGLVRLLRTRPDHACGGGPVAAVMQAARALGATGARVLRYGDSGDVSGDKSAVVGYMAAAFGTFS